MTRLIIPLAITGSNMAPMLKYSNGVERSIEANRYIPLFHVNPANQSSFIFLETKISYLQNIGEFYGRNVSRRVLSNEFTVHDSTYRSLRNTILSFEREEWKGFQRFFSMRLHVSRHSSICLILYFYFFHSQKRMHRDSIPFKEGAKEKESLQEFFVEKSPSFEREREREGRKNRPAPYILDKQ